MIRLTVAPLSGHLWAVSCTPSAFDEAVKVQMHAMPGIKWNVGEKRYEGAPEAIKVAVDILRAAKVTLSDVMNLALSGGIPCGAGELRAYQKIGAGWCVEQLAATRGAMLADEMGIGKTAQAITAAVMLGVVSALIVCPAIVVPHWKAQLKKWAAGVPGNSDVLSYEAFTRRQKRGELQAAALLILDEAHYTSNPKAQRTQAVRGYIAQHAPMVLELSGTPMTTRPRDLWQPLDLMHPGRWGSKFSFEKRYCNGRFEEIPGLDKAVWTADGATHIDELAVRLKAVMLRRTKAEVALELPPRTRQVIEVELPKKAAKALKAAAAALTWSGAAQGVGSLLSQVESYKVDAALSLARDVLASGGRPLLLTTRKATAQQLSDELRCPCAHGDVPPDKRRAVLLSGDGAAVSTIYAVTTGIDLTEFDCIIFTGLDWVPSTLLQAEARIHRIGQLRGVTIYYLVGVGSIDEVVRERVIDRLEIIAALAGGDEAGFAVELGGNDDNLLSDLFKQLTTKEAA